MSTNDNNKTFDDGQDSKVSKRLSLGIAKAIAPALLIAAPGVGMAGNVSMRSNVSRTVSRFRAKSVVHVVKNESALNPELSKEQPSANPFSVFTNNHAESPSKDSEMSTNGEALSFLKENGLLAATAKVNEAKTSGDTDSRKNFAASGSCTGTTAGTNPANYTTLTACTATGGGTWHPGGGPDSDGTLVAASGVVEPINLPSTILGSGNKINVFDFKIQDGGGGDGFTLDVSQIKLNLSGTASGNFSKMRFTLSGCASVTDVAPVTNTVTFGAVGISVADAGNTTCTVSAYWNDNTGITDNQTFTISIDGDVDLTIDTNKTNMTGTNTTVSTGAMATTVTATKLAFSTTPTSGDASGQAMTSFAVAAQDAVGNTDVDYSTNVTIAKNSGLGAVSGTTTVTPTSGVATFSNVVYTATSDGEGYALAATSGGLTQVTSSALISDIVATQLVFSPAPTSGDTSGSSMTSFAVAAKDADGSTDVDFSSNITISKNSGSGAVSGTTTVAASSGVATFSNVIYTAAADGESYVLDADGGSLSTLTSSSLTSDVVATKLGFSTAPTSGDPSGLAMTTFQVAGQDANGTTDTAYSSDITISKGSGLGAISGTTTVTPSSGVATFSAVTYTASSDGESYTISADDGVYTTITSSALLSDIVATKLIFDTQPAPLSGLSGNTLDFTTDPVVKAVNAISQVDVDWPTNIVLEEVSGGGSAILESSNDTDGAGNSTVTQAPSSGVVTFSGLTANYANATQDTEVYKLRASSIGITSADSSWITSDKTSIASADYNATTGDLVVTGLAMVANGSGADVDATKFTISGEGGAGNAYTLTADTSNVELTSSTSFTLTLGATDKAAVNQILNKTGVSSTGATTYNLAAADNWLTDASLTSNIEDLTANAITVSAVPTPTISSASYDVSTGALVVTGANLVQYSGANNDIDVTKLKIVGAGGSADGRTLTSSSVDIIDGTSFSVTLNAGDVAAVATILNKNGDTSTGGTTYNLEAAEDWAVGADAAVNVVDTTGNTITVSNVAVPTVTSGAYDANTGILMVTGTGFLKLGGATNDIDATKLELSGEDGQTYTLTSSSVEITSDTQFSVTLNSTDQHAVNPFINKNGTLSTGGATYNLNAMEDWAAGADATVNVVDATNALTASNVAVPAITSAAYDATTGILTATGTGFSILTGVTNDVDSSLFTFTGEDNATYQLTSSADVDITSDTEFSIQLDATDQAGVNLLMNKAGLQSTGGVIYNLSAAEDWATGADILVNVADTSNPITVSNVPAPTITGAAYDYTTRTLSVTGTGFLPLTGANNDIDVSMLTITGEGGATYTLSSSSDVDMTSGTEFSVTLTGADIYNVEYLLNADGLASATSTTTYNLAANEDWNLGADSAVSIADATGNGITVSNYTAPGITSATYDWSTGQLVVTGTHFVNNPGATNDVDASMFRITGEGGTYQLTNSSDVELTSDSELTLLLSEQDKVVVHGVLNKNGTVSSGAITYDLEVLDNWLSGSPAAADISYSAGAGITVSNTCTPNMVAATYDAPNHNLTVTGTCFFGRIGDNNDIDAGKLTFIGGDSASYTLQSTANVDVTSTTSFTIHLSNGDDSVMYGIYNQLGTQSSYGTVYDIQTINGWMMAVDPSINTSGDTVDNGVNVTISPMFYSATYNPASGTLVVTGSNFEATPGGDDIIANLLTFTGEGGNTYDLTDTANIESAIDGFTLALSATDRAGVNALLNNTGTASADSTTYELSGSDGWCGCPSSAAADISDSVGITVENTAPAIGNLDDDTVVFTVGGNAVELDELANLTFADLTTPVLDGGTLTVSISANGFAAEDVLQIGDVGTISVSGSDIVHSDDAGTTIGSFTGGTGGDALVISLNSAATSARVQDLLSALQYSNTDIKSMNAGIRDLTLSLTDGDTGDLSSGDQLLYVNVVRAPVLDLNGATAGLDYAGNFIKGGTPVSIASASAEATDDGLFKSLTVTLTDAVDGADETLSTTLGDAFAVGIQVNGKDVNIGAFDANTGALTLSFDAANGDATDMQALLASIRYDNANAAATLGARTITVIGADSLNNVGPTSTSVITVVNPAPNNGAPGGEVVITGLAEEDQLLTADASTVTDSNGLGEFSYQWLRNGVAVEGATNATYLLGDADVGAVFTVSISYVDGNNFDNSLTSAATAVVANVNDAPSGEVVIAGEAVEDQTLTASNTLADVDGLGEISYQWQRDGADLEGKTGTSYLLTQADVGSLLSVKASYTDGFGQAESVTSAQTAAVANVNDAPSGEVTISGTAQVGETLSASHTLADEDGLGTVTYQWQRGGVAITGATAESYLLVSEDAGQEITVVASYIDAQGTLEAMTSSPVTPTTGGELPQNNGLAITAPADITVNATGLFTEVSLGTAVATDAEDGELPVTKDSNAFFSPGSHTVTWSAVDSDGHEATDTQTVNVIPMVDFSKNQNTAEGSAVSFSVILNGPAVNYPVTVPYTVGGTAATDGSDHDLVDGSVTFEQGQLKVTVTLNIVDDGVGEGREDIIITMGEPANAVTGPKNTHRINVFEDNVAPDVVLEARQSAEQGTAQATRIVSQDGGLVVINANVTDPNQNDSHTYDWSKSDNALVDMDDDDNTFTFDPAGLSPGFYKVRIEVSDGDKQGKDRLKLRVEAALPTLDEEQDSDNDGISDRDEGLGDNDDDGIPDFLDSANLARNVVQERQTQDTSFLMETEPGLVLSLGEVAFRANGAKTEVSTDDITNHGNDGLGAQQDEEEYEYNGGLFDFNVEELPVAGQSVSIVVAQFSPIPAGAVYRKLMPSGWQDFVIDDNNSVASALGSAGFCPPPGDVAYTDGLTEGHWCVQLTIEDGGPNDADGEVNQAIDDPGGVAAVNTTGNTQPVVVDDEATLKRNTSAYIDVLANDTDADGDTLSITSANVDLGTVTIVDNRLYFVAQENHYGTATISYGVSDGNGGSASGTVVVSVELNKAPVATNDSAQTAFETAVIIDVLANDTDADGDSLMLVGAATEDGSVNISDNKLTFTPASNFSGDAVISYTVSDGEAETEGRVTVMVAAGSVVEQPETIVVTNKSSGGSLPLWALAVLLLGGLRRRSAGK